MKKKFANWIKVNRLHVLLWTLFILYETVVVGILFNQFSDPHIYLVHYAITIVLFYLHANVVLPGILKHKVWRYLIPIVLCAELTIYIVSHFSADKLMMLLGMIKNEPDYILDWGVILRNLYRGVYFMGFSTGYYFLRTFIKERRERQLVEQERLKDIITMQAISQELALAENAFLKAQINPHFLFNTLDFIYHHVQGSSPVAGEAVLRLSKIMRYAITSGNDGDKIILDTEIKQVENLLFLRQLDLHDVKPITFDYTAEVQQLRFAPLILLTLVENIFKHGVLHVKDQQPVISLYVEEGSLVISTENLAKAVQATGEHIGLDNIKKRLFFMYGDKFSFEYGLDALGHFKSRVSVELSALS